MIPALAPVAALVISYALIALLLRWRAGRFMMDAPNDRSLHEVPVPRLGGVALIMAAAGASVALGPAVRAWLLPALGLAAVSVLDDWRGLPVPWRLAAHFLAAIGFLYWSTPELPLPALVGTALAFVWMTNLYNFMDGADGLAGGQAVFGFGTYGLAAWQDGRTDMALFCFSVAAAALGFLRFNLYPARVFMGDAGSIPLGFLAAALAYEGWRQGLWSPAFPILVFSPFIVDASATLLRRLLRGEKFWEAHNTHYYQRLIRMGWSHRKTAWVEYALMAGAGLAGIATLRVDGGWAAAIGAAWLAVLAALAAVVDRNWRARNATNG